MQIQCTGLVHQYLQLYVSLCDNSDTHTNVALLLLLLCPCTDTHKTLSSLVFTLSDVHVLTRSDPTCRHVNSFSVCAVPSSSGLVLGQKRRKQVQPTEAGHYGKI